MNGGLRACVLALGLSGCALMGPNYVVNPGGMPAGVAAGTDGTVGVFAEAFRASQALPRNPQAAAYMVQVGVELEYQLCADFFRKGGKEQQWLLFGKDFLAIAGTLATGILGAVGAATGGTNASAIAWTGLATAGGVSAINLYARNFLFSEDNIQAVQDLTLRAVDTARTQALSSERLAGYTFATGVTALTDVQAQCEVQNILVLVRKSLNAAKTVPTGELNAAVAFSVQVSLGGVINGGAPISDAELQALYWLEFVPMTADQRTAVYNQLSALVISPLKNGGVNPEFTNREGTIRGILGGLPPAIAQEIRDRIQKVIADAPPPPPPPSGALSAPAVAAAAAAGTASAMRRNFGPLPVARSTTTTFGRIGVDIR